MKTLFKNWSLYEKIWFGTAFITILIVGVLLEESPLGFIASLSGITCVILVAKGKIANFYFGIIQSLAYGYIAYTYQLFGESMLNWFFFVPFQVAGFIIWRKNSKKPTTEKFRGADITAKRLSKKQWFIFLPTIIGVSLIYAVILENIGAREVRLDSFAVIISVFAQILTTFRFAEQWLMWITVNVLTVTLWFITLTTTGGNNWTVLVMWCAFLINSIYGYINWLKLSKLEKQRIDTSKIEIIEE